MLEELLKEYKKKIETLKPHKSFKNGVWRQRGWDAYVVDYMTLKHPFDGIFHGNTPLIAVKRLVKYLKQHEK